MSHPLWPAEHEQRIARYYAALEPHEVGRGESLARAILRPEYYGRYAAVGLAARVPAMVVGLIHAMECNLNFKRHLHNGDPMLDGEGRPICTRSVPAGRGPFKSWEEGAVDALTHERPWRPAGMVWSLMDAAYFLECYNGLGYLKKGKISPYLLGGDDDIPPGKYVADGRYDPDERTDDPSDQVGALLILRAAAGLGLLPLELLLAVPALDAKLVQVRLNGLMTFLPPLKVDGDLGPLSRGRAELLVKLMGKAG